MNDTSRYDGVFTALLTPCRNDGSLDIDALGPLIDFQVQAGVTGLFILGTAGQGPMLGVDERILLTKEILGRTLSRLEVIVHVGTMPTSAATHLARTAVEAGATAIAAIPPVYYEHDTASVRAYYEAIAAAALRVPLFAYNNPAATGHDLRPIDAASMFRAGVIAGVKQASANLADLHSLVALGVPVWIANATLNMAALSMGARGSISTITNILPEPFVALRAAVLAGDLQRAVALQDVINRATTPLRQPAIGGLHFGAQLRGLPAGSPRPPLRTPTEEERRTIASALQSSQYAASNGLTATLRAFDA